MNNFSSVANRMHMDFGGKLLDSLRIKTQVFERP
jgi:hypothetical protein